MRRKEKRRRNRGNIDDELYNFHEKDNESKIPVQISMISNFTTHPV